MRRGWSSTRDTPKRPTRFDDGGLDRERELPDGLTRCLDERARCGRPPDRRRVAGREQRSGAAVNDGLGRRDHDDEVGAGDGGMNPNVSRDRHEIGIGSVMDDGVAPERAGLGRR